MNCCGEREEAVGHVLDPPQRLGQHTRDGHNQPYQYDDQDRPAGVSDCFRPQRHVVAPSKSNKDGSSVLRQTYVSRPPLGWRLRLDGMDG